MIPGKYAITNRWGLFAWGLQRHMNPRSHVVLESITSHDPEKRFHCIHFSVPSGGRGQFLFTSSDPELYVSQNFARIGS